MRASRYWPLVALALAVMLLQASRPDWFTMLAGQWAKPLPVAADPHARMLAFQMGQASFAQLWAGSSR